MYVYIYIYIYIHIHTYTYIHIHIHIHIHTYIYRLAGLKELHETLGSAAPSPHSPVMPPRHTQSYYNVIPYRSHYA